MNHPTLGIEVSGNYIEVLGIPFLEPAPHRVSDQIGVLDEPSGLGIDEERDVSKVVQHAPSVAGSLELSSESLKTSLSCRLVENDQTAIRVAGLTVVPGDEPIKAVGELLEGVLDGVLRGKGRLVNDDAKQAPLTFAPESRRCAEAIADGLAPELPRDLAPRALTSMHVTAMELEGSRIDMTGSGSSPVERFDQPVNLALEDGDAREHEMALIRVGCGASVVEVKNMHDGDQKKAAEWNPSPSELQKAVLPTATYLYARHLEVSRICCQ